AGNCAGDVEGELEVVPGGFPVGDVDRPSNAGVVGIQLSDDFAGRIVAEDSKLRGLAFQGAGCVFVEARLSWRCSGNLGPDEELMFAVADPSDADAGMDGRSNDLVVWHSVLLRDLRQPHATVDV